MVIIRSIRSILQCFASLIKLLRDCWLSSSIPFSTYGVLCVVSPARTGSWIRAQTPKEDRRKDSVLKAPICSEHGHQTVRLATCPRTVRSALPVIQRRGH